MKKLSLLAVLALSLAAVPASAKDHPGQGQGQDQAQKHAAKAQKCAAHDVGYVAGGKLVSAALTKNDDGTYSGDLTIAVSRANHHGKADKATSHTYTLDHARVNLHGQDPAALVPGSRAFVLGRTSVLRKKCDQTGFVATTTIRKADVKAPKTDKPAGTETETPESASASS